MGDAATMPPDIARALLDSNSEKVGGIQAEALAAFTAVELWFGVHAAQTQIAGDALEHLNDAHGACDRGEHTVKGIPMMAKLAGVSAKVREGTAKRRELVEATRHLHGRTRWWRRS